MNEKGDASPEKVIINLNLDELASIAQVGGRRASTFLGLALNAMSRDDVFEYRLGELAITDDSFRWPIEMCAPDITPQSIAEAKQAFTAWIISSALRDLLEHFCLMLDKAYQMVSWVAHAKHKLTTDEVASLRANYNRTTSVGHKLRLLKQHFALECKDAAMLDSLYKARNALGHGFGIVRDHDTSDGSRLEIKWRAMDAWVNGNDTGARTSIKNIHNVRLSEPQTLEFQPVQRQKEFAVGSRITLEAIDLSEICHFVAVTCTLELLKELAEVLSSHGVSVNRPASERSSSGQG